MGVIAGTAFHGFVTARFLPTPHWVGFRLIILTMFAFNFLWWSIADRRLARHIANASASRTLRMATSAFAVAMMLPLLYMLWRGHIPQLLISPLWYATAITLWNLGLVVLMPPVALIRIVGIAVARIAGWRRSTPTPEVDLQRRALLRTSVASLPVVLLGGATFGSVGRQNDFLIRREQLPAPWLPDRLRGLTITQISDLHVGRLYRPSMFPRLIDAVNALDSDLLIVTGDLVDNSNEMLPPTLDALGHMRHRHGMFIAIGNHDMIDDREEFIRMTRERYRLLINERQTILIGGERLAIAGLDYSGRDESSPMRAGHRGNVIEMLEGYQKESEGPLIVMAHHPHAWDRLRERDVPLTLSGHTHGGQIMFTPPGAPLELGAGQLLFKYIRGYYRDGGQTLYVNSGVGNWFPMRINAPAEIVQFRLV
jgi:predicted MPP superfamily phosphohydrolase